MNDSPHASRDDTSVVPAVFVATGPETPRRQWTRSLVKCAASAWLLYHLSGLALAPATVPPSPFLFRQMYGVFRPYLEFLNLNQGNHFFAPDPGVSTLVAFTVETADGGSVSGRMPDRQTQPRLLYHRHFMLTESLANADYLEPGTRDLLIRALARQLLREHHGKSVTMSRVTHELPSTEQVLAGTKLDAPESYVEEPIGRFEWHDFFP